MRGAGGGGERSRCSPALQDTVSGTDRTVKPKGRVSRGKRVETQWEQAGKRGVGGLMLHLPVSSSFDVWRRLCLEWRMSRRKVKKGVSFSLTSDWKMCWRSPLPILVLQGSGRARPCRQPSFLLMDMLWVPVQGLG